MKILKAVAILSLLLSITSAHFRAQKLDVFVIPESKIVCPGTKYSAEIFALGANVKSIKCWGVDLKVEGNKANLAFTATPSGSYNKDGLAEKRYKISVESSDGAIAEKEITYYVTKPVITIHGAAVRGLYKGVSTDLNINVPALGITYNPAFEAHGATIDKQASGIVTIIPNEDLIKLTVKSNGNTVGTESFIGINIPSPRVAIIKSDQTEVNLLDGENISDIATFKIQVLADPEFKKMHPFDAYYKKDSVQIILKRNWKELARTADVNEVISLLSKAKPGDCLTIVLSGIKRRTSRGSYELLPANYVYNIPLK